MEKGQIYAVFLKGGEVWKGAKGFKRGGAGPPLGIMGLVRHLTWLHFVRFFLKPSDRGMFSVITTLCPLSLGVLCTVKLIRIIGYDNSRKRKSNPVSPLYDIFSSSFLCTALYQDLFFLNHCMVYFFLGFFCFIV